MSKTDVGLRPSTHVVLADFANVSDEGSKYSGIGTRVRTRVRTRVLEYVLQYTRTPSSNRTWYDSVGS